MPKTKKDRLSYIVSEDLLDRALDISCDKLRDLLMSGEKSEAAADTKEPRNKEDQ